jgi:hypothetical protein
MSSLSRHGAIKGRKISSKLPFSENLNRTKGNPFFEYLEKTRGNPFFENSNPAITPMKNNARYSSSSMRNPTTHNNIFADPHASILNTYQPQSGITRRRPGAFRGRMNGVFGSNGNLPENSHAGGARKKTPKHKKQTKKSRK